MSDDEGVLNKNCNTKENIVDPSSSAGSEVVQDLPRASNNERSSDDREHVEKEIPVDSRPIAALTVDGISKPSERSTESSAPARLVYSNLRTDVATLQPCDDCTVNHSAASGVTKSNSRVKFQATQQHLGVYKNVSDVEKGYDPTSLTSGIKEFEPEETQTLLSGLSEENVKLRTTVEALREELAFIRQHFLEKDPSTERSVERRLTRAASSRKSFLFANFSSRKNLLETKKETLPEDSFSFLVVSPICTTPFFSALAVYAIQMSTFVLLPYSIIDMSNSKNIFGIPVNVNAAVRATQLIALTITVLTQDDIRTGLNQINNGYNPNTVGRAFENATRLKFAFSVLARCTEGCLSLIVTFVLIATADNVLDLLLNFTAMAFVSQLDEIFFALAMQGFAGRKNMAQAENISESSFDVTKGGCHLSPFLLLIITMFLMMIGWTFLMLEQTTGALLCDTIFIQFGDDFVPALGTFGGLYDRQNEHTGVFSGDRVKYVDKRTGRASFYYCKDLSSWVFSYEGSNDEMQADASACHWIARSPVTDTFDLTQLADATWTVRNSEDLEVELDRFFMSCYDCGQMDVVCGGHGTCSNAVCSCDTNWFGLRCEFREPCSVLQIDERYSGFIGTRQWPNSFDILQQENKTVQVYDRPVFINEMEPGIFSLLYYTGRRWVVTSSEVFPKALLSNSTITKADLSRFFQEGFHAYYSKIPVVFISMPTDVKTPSDLSVPVGIQWFRTFETKGTDEINGQGPDLLGGAMEVSLLCSVCSDHNPCFYDGQCESGFCKCAIGASGTLCQIPPVGNGRCDEAYNTPLFQYDGGDCCESTCISTDEFVCGKDKVQLIDYGYPFCTLPVQRWISGGKQLDGEEYTRFGASVALSGNGQILAVGEPDSDRVRLLDKDGSEWQVRGRLLHGPPGSGFGSQVALSDGLPDASGNFFALPPIYLAVAARTARFVRVFKCATDGCSPMGEDLNGTVVDLSYDGQKLVVAGDGRVQLFEFSIGAGGWNILDQMAVNVSTTPVVSLSVSLSGDGNTIAISHLEDEYSYSMQPGIMDGGGNDTVSVYFWDGQSLSQKGNKFVHSWNLYESFDFIERSRLGNRELFYQSVDLSYNGSVLAFGMATSLSQPGVHVYLYENSTGWTTLGAISPSKNSNVTEMGRSVSLSHDGSIIVVGVGVNASGQNTEWTGWYTLEWNGTNWMHRDTIERTGTMTSVAFSADGSGLAIGLPLNRPRMAGSCIFYQFLPETCPIGTSSLRLSLTLDGDAGATTWDIVSSNNRTPIFEGGPYIRFQTRADYNFVTVVFEDCLPKDLCYIFSIYDGIDNNGIEWKIPNGLISPASYNLFLDGKLSARGQLQLWAARTYFGDSCVMACPPGSHLVRVLTRTCVKFHWVLQDSSGTIVLQDDNNEDCDAIAESNFWKESCVPIQDCYVLSVLVPLENNKVSGETMVNAVIRVYFNNTQVGRDAQLPVHNPGLIDMYYFGNCTGNNNNTSL